LYIGRQIVDFIEEILENNIYAELIQPDEASVLDRIARFSVPKRFCSIIYFSCRAFLITDVMSRKENITTSGATACCALIKSISPGQRKLYVANVGDSRAVLCSSLDHSGYKNLSRFFKISFISRNLVQTECGYVAHRLTKDHTADDPDEHERIKQAGGFVTRGRQAS
jgi:hypothetical protein